MALLLSNGVDPNGYRNTCKFSYLQIAAGMGNLEIVNLLITHGAQLDSADSIQETPLHAAINNKQWDVAKLLITSGANVNAKDYEDKTPLDGIQDENKKNELLSLSKFQISNASTWLNFFSVSNSHEKTKEQQRKNERNYS